MADEEQLLPRHQFVIGTLCYALTTDAVLLLQRTRPPQQGKWSPPGGKLEFGEAPQEAIIREMQEETGLTIHKPELCGVVTVFDADWPIQWLLFIYRTHQFSGTLRQSDEGQLRWVPFAELDDYDRPYGDRLHWPHIIGRKPGIWRAKFVYDTPYTLVSEQIYAP